MTMKRVTVEVLTDESGDFTQSVSDWNGWYVYAIRFVNPPITTDALDSTNAVIRITDPDIGLSVWNKTGYSEGMYRVLLNTYSESGSVLSQQAARRSFRFFDTIQVTVSAGGNAKKCTIHIFLSKHPL